VSLRQSEAGRASLTVSDNGVGLPPEFQIDRSRTLGLQVVSTLIRQLSAELSVTHDGGSDFTWAWKLPETEVLAVSA